MEQIAESSSTDMERTKMQIPKMQIPSQYVGAWAGKIVDANRAKNYDGEIILSVDSIVTVYHMALGQKEGKLTRQYEADGFLVLKETVGSWSGTLMLYMDAPSNLKCVWRYGSKFSSEATMNRITSAVVRLD